MTLTKAFVTGRRELPVGTPINELIALALRDKTFAPFVLEALLKEVSRQKTCVLFISRAVLSS